MRLSSRQSILAGVGAAALALVAMPKDATACVPDGYYGTVCWTAATYCPRDYDLLVGQIYDANDMPAFFSVVGFWWGGDGRVTFGVPFMQGREIIGQGQGPGLTWFELGDYIGVEKRALYEEQMPSHSHLIDLSVFSATATMMASSAIADEVSPTGAVWATTGTDMFSNTADTTMAAGVAELTLSTLYSGGSMTTTVPPQGSQTYVDTMGPQLGLMPCVAFEGDYPPRP